MLIQIRTVSLPLNKTRSHEKPPLSVFDKIGGANATAHPFLVTETQVSLTEVLSNRCEAVLDDYLGEKRSTPRNVPLILKGQPDRALLAKHPSAAQRSDDQFVGLGNAGACCSPPISVADQDSFKKKSFVWSLFFFSATRTTFKKNLVSETS